MTGLACTLLVAVMVAGSIQSFRLRREVFGDTAGVGQLGASDWQSVAAVAQVEYARARRAEACVLVNRDQVWHASFGLDARSAEPCLRRPWPGRRQPRGCAGDGSRNSS